MFSQKNRVFLDTNTISVLNGKCNIILSPSLYWTRLQKLPVKTEFGAKEFANSVFEGALPKGKFTFYVQKTSLNHFRFFAFDKKVILDLFLKANGKIQDINALYFAQNEFGKEYIDIGDDRCLTVLDKSLGDASSISIVPSYMVQPSKHINEAINKIKLSNKKTTLNISESTDQGFFIFIFTLLMFLNIGSGVNIINYNNQVKSIKNNLNDRLDELELPNTIPQLEIVNEKFQNRLMGQLNIRTNLKNISKSIHKNKKLKIIRIKEILDDK